MALAVLSFAILIPPTSALAAGEQYNWTDTTYTGITASGGGYASTFTFTGAATPDGGATFNGTASYTCKGSTLTTPLVITINPNFYASGKPAIPTTAALSLPAGAKPNLTCFSVLNVVEIEVPKGIDPITGQSTTTTAPTCNQGSFSWLACPLIDNLTKSISSLATGALTPFLQVNVISPSSAPQLYAVWGSLRNLADGFFILIFFAIIFATMTGQDFGMFDQYTVKKIWPYLLAAAILVQFSFLISCLLVDVGNVAGAGIHSIIDSAIPTSSGPATVSNLTGNLAGIGIGGLLGGGALLVALGSTLSAVPLLMALAISLFVVFLTLGLRFLLIAVLIVASPLACIALVLPNTRHWFYDWLKFLFRLVLMYPIIIGIISIAGIINQVLPVSADTATNGAASFAILLMKVVLVIGTFLIIPATFKFAGKGLERAYGLLNGTATRGKGALKSSDMWQQGKDERQRRQSKYMGRVMSSNTVSKLGSKGPIGRVGAGFITAGAGMALLGAPSNRRALDTRNNKLVSADKKVLADLVEAQNPGNLRAVFAAYGEADPTKRKAAIAKLRNSVPNLAQIGSNESGRRAMASMLADRGLLGSNDMQNLLAAGKTRSHPFGVSSNVSEEYSMLMSEVGKERSSKPFVAARIGKLTTDYKVKDMAGNVVDEIVRQPGDLDLNAAALVIRKTKASDFNEKFSPENWNIPLDLINPEADDHRRRIAQEAVELMADELPAREVYRAFDVDDKRNNYASLEARVLMARSFRAGRETFMENDRRKEKYQAVMAKLDRDHDLSYQLAIVGAGAAKYIVEGLSNTGRANLAIDWMDGKEYEPGFDYDAGRRP